MLKIIDETNMNIEKFLESIDEQITSAGKKRKELNRLIKNIESLESRSQNDKDAARKLQELYEYQQSDKFESLKNKTMKEIELIQAQLVELQEDSKESLVSEITIAEKAMPSIRTSKKRRDYI